MQNLLKKARFLFSLWALVTATLFYLLLHAIGVSPVSSVIYTLIWYSIGLGVAFSINRFHHPTNAHTFVLPEPGAEPPTGYSSVTFSNQGKTIYVPPDTDLRTAALAQGVAVYYGINQYVNCFGLGQCGTCRFTPDQKAPTAFSPPTWEERFTLGDDAGKVRLACQTHIYGNCTVNNAVAEEFGKVRYYSVINGAILGIFSLLMLGVILWMGGDMIGLL